MAFTPTVTLSQRSPFCLGSPTSFMVAVSNSGTTTASVASVTLQVVPGSVPHSTQKMPFAVGTLPSLPQNATAYVFANVVFHGAQRPDTSAALPGGVVVRAHVTFSDGTAASSADLSPVISLPYDGSIEQPNPVADFSKRANAVLLPALLPR